jgi:hypothetical protein
LFLIKAKLWGIFQLTFTFQFTSFEEHINQQIPQFESSFVPTIDFFASNYTNFAALDLNVLFPILTSFLPSSSNFHIDMEPINAK